MRRTHPLVILLVAFLLPFMGAAAQDLAGLEQGIRPYGNYHGGDIDSVSMVNLKPSIHIPLISYPQRGGKLNLSFSVALSLPTFTPQTLCHTYKPYLCFILNYTTTWSALGSIMVNTPLSGQLNVVTDGLVMGTCINCGQSQAQPYRIWEPDGAIHQLGALSSGKWIALDASGYLYDPTTHTTTDRNGTRYYWPSTSSPNSHLPKIEDTNGNLISVATDSNGNSTNYIDTLGRSIPLPPPLGGTSTSDFSHCSGPLPIVSAYLWSPPGPTGGVSTFKFCYAQTSSSMSFDFDCPPGVTCTWPTTGGHQIQSIVLPNLTAWTFQYDNSYSGMLNKIIFPTGGSISYAWGSTDWNTGPPNHLYYPETFHIYSRTVDANDGTGPHTYTYGQQISTGTIATIVTDPLGDDSVHTATRLGVGMSYYETELDQYQGSHSTGTLLKKTVTSYTSSVDPYGAQPVGYQMVINVVPNIITATDLVSGKVSQVVKTYDPPSLPLYVNGGLSSGKAILGVLTKQTESDYGTGSPGPLLRTTNTTYMALSGPNASSYMSNNLLSLPYTVQMLNGSGAQMAYTTFGYDETSLGSSGVGSTEQHDTAPPAGTYRGNQTSSSLWLNSGTLTCQNGHTAGTNSNVTSKVVYFDTGTTQTVADPCGNTTTYAFSNTYWGAFPTIVTNALLQATNNTYDFSTGLLASTQDPNLLTTSYTYDSMWRIYQVTHPDGGIDTVTHQESSYPFTATLSTKINSSISKTETNVFDGLGRATHNQLTSDPQGTVYVDTTYDVIGRVSTVSNPYRTAPDITSSPGTTTYGYDALNRKKTVTYPDGSILKTAYCGPSTLVTDPTTRWRRSRVDGLGRLVEVDEPNAVGASVVSTGCPGTGEPIWVTSYTLDALGNLTNIVQNGSHQRSFTYDSFSRLLCSSNPESATAACPAFGATTFPTGTLTYVYNPDGVALKKTDARTLYANYTYDALHRELTRTYSNGDPTVTTAYDQSPCLSLSACQNIGHRTSMTDGAGSEAWAYQVDRTNSRSAHADQRTTTSGSNNITKTATYYLDYAGNVTQAVYPTGRTVNYAYDAADRPSTATDASNGITYATGLTTSPGGTCLPNLTCYTPQGSLYAVSIGQSSTFTVGLNVTNIYNTRLQPNEFKASSTGGSAIDISYSFVDPINGGNAGHVFQITNNLNSNNRTQNFTYDQLNRITSAGTTATTGTYCWGYQYSYDAWGNLLSQAGWTPNYSACTETVMAPVTADGNNHISGFGYDAAGNATGDGIYTYAWDSESQLKSAANVNYTYDGDGRRVSKVGSKLYWYGAGSEILAETDASGNTQNEYIFFGGKRVAMLPASSTAQFYIEDFLGSSRIVTNNAGVVCYDADFTPFGGERAYTNSCTQNNYKFEGKERDTETQNDEFGARYYSWRFGRWLSADWSNVPVAVPYANLSNPQTLNLYSMVADDPDSFADLDGHTWLADNCGGGLGSDICASGYARYKGEDPANPYAENKAAGLLKNEQQAQNPKPRTLPSTVRKAYKWYQFFTKWRDIWNEASQLRDEKKTDQAIYDKASNVVFDPIANYKSLALGNMAEIVRLEHMNLIYDTVREGLKFSSEVDPNAKLMGATYDEMFNFYGNLRDYNNRQIDQLLDQAATQTGQQQH